MVAAMVSPASLHRALVDNAICAAMLGQKGLSIQQLAARLNAVRIAATLAHTNTDEAKLLTELASDAGSDAA